MSETIPFPDRKYNVILCDPPWSYSDSMTSGKRGAKYKYNLMSDREIAELPVSEIAADDCMLFLWTTFPRIFAAESIINAWSFQYKTLGFNWVKTNKVQTRKLFLGCGSYTRSNSEVCLLATKGKPKRVSASVRSTIISPVREHSRKPDVIRDRIVELCGDVPRIELFARENSLGWDTWGKEAPEVSEAFLAKEVAKEETI